jgi:hypothetical protein
MHSDKFMVHGSHVGVHSGGRLLRQGAHSCCGRPSTQRIFVALIDQRYDATGHHSLIAVGHRLCDCYRRSEKFLCYVQSCRGCTITLRPPDSAAAGRLELGNTCNYRTLVVNMADLQFILSSTLCSMHCMYW